MECIYCKNTSSFDSRAHIFPEGLMQNDLVLPSGVECDACNNYFKDLDSALLAHNHIYSTIQYFGLIGKDGRERKKLGHIERIRGKWRLFAKKKDIQEVTISETEVKFLIANPPQFDESKFRRSLYHIAFNYLAFTTAENPEYVRSEKFDRLRNYVRRPSTSKEQWPYLQIIVTPVLNKSTFRAIVSANVISLDRALITIKIFGNDFYLDLLNANQFEKIQLNLEPHHLYRPHFNLD